MGSAMTAAGRLRLLEAAFDQGVRHFDTAPLYGMGLAEEVLSIFARGRRSDITITSKFGLLPPPSIPCSGRPFQLPVPSIVMSLAS
jgi:aryl-alcohol dehydrogenase-like predicted oxidoreductase